MHQLSDLVFRQLDEKYKSIDQYQLEEEYSADTKKRSARPPSGSLGSTPRHHPRAKNSHYSSMASRDVTDRSVAGNQASMFEDSSSQATASDFIPDSATFFEEQPIASNNDFETATESTQSRLTLTQSVGGHSASLRSLRSVGLEVDVPISDSQGSMSIHRSAHAGRELRRLFEPSLQSAEELDRTGSSSHLSTQIPSNPHNPEPQPDSSAPAPRRSARLSLGPR